MEYEQTDAALATEVDGDAPSWVKQAAASSGAGAPMQSLGDILSDDELQLNLGDGAGDMHTNFTDETGEMFAEDNTPAASSVLHKRPARQPNLKAVDSDQQTIILETLFPQGIPAPDIKKAVFLSGVIDELIAYADGDIEAISALLEIISSHKVK